jgi:hypothetical protein
MRYLDQSEKRHLYKSILNETELKNLKDEVLYVPDYVLINFNKFTGDETKKHDEKDIFKNYKFEYKLMSTDELNEKIMNDTTSFYYLIYIKSSADKFVSVINSLTGEIIYSNYTYRSYNIKSKDLKKLRKKIKKS